MKVFIFSALMVVVLPSVAFAQCSYGINGITGTNCPQATQSPLPPPVVYTPGPTPPSDPNNPQNTPQPQQYYAPNGSSITVMPSPQSNY